MTAEPLWVEFCGNVVQVDCPDGDLRDTLELLLADCRVDRQGQPIVCNYRVSIPSPDVVKVERDGETIYDGRAADWVPLLLLQNLTSALISACRSALNVHSAGLAHGLQGIMLCGASASGKSTLAAWLAGSGYLFLTDELVGISPDSWTMTGLARPLHLKRGSGFVLDRWLGEASRDNIRRLEDGTALVPPSALVGRRIVRQAVPHMVIFPRYRAAAGLVVERLSAANTAFRLAQCLVNAVNLERNGMPQVAALAKRVCGYAVEFSRPDAVADWLSQNLG